MKNTYPNLLPLSAMARVLHVPAAWLRSEADAGRIPHVDAGAAMLFNPQTVEDILLERARPKEPDRLVGCALRRTESIDSNDPNNVSWDVNVERLAICVELFRAIDAHDWGRARWLQLALAEIGVGTEFAGIQAALDEQDDSNNAE